MFPSKAAAELKQSYAAMKSLNVIILPTASKKSISPYKAHSLERGKCEQMEDFVFHPPQADYVYFFGSCSLKEAMMGSVITDCCEISKPCPAV